MKRLLFIAAAALAAPLLASGQATTGSTGTSPRQGEPGSQVGTGVTPQGQGAQGGASGSATMAPGVGLCPPGTVPDSGTTAGTGQGGMTGTGTSSTGTGSSATAGGSTASGTRCVPVGGATPGTTGTGSSSGAGPGVGTPGTTGAGTPGAGGAGTPGTGGTSGAPGAVGGPGSPGGTPGR